MKVTREDTAYRPITIVLETREDLCMIKNVCDRNVAVAEMIFDDTDAVEELGKFLRRLSLELVEVERL